MAAAALQPPCSLGNTPLDNAIIYANPDDRAIDLLLPRSPEINKAPEQLAWIPSAAARRGHVRLFEYYRERGGEALFADEPTRRAIMRSAITGGSLELVKKLQTRGIPLVLSANQTRREPGAPELPAAHRLLPGTDSTRRRTHGLRARHCLPGSRHDLHLARRSGDVLADGHGDHDDEDPGRALDAAGLCAVQRAERRLVRQQPGRVGLLLRQFRWSSRPRFVFDLQSV